MSGGSRKSKKLDVSAFRDLYCDIMEEVKQRITVISDVIEGQITLAQQPACELCFLQLRMICELIALGCLAAHGDVLNAGSKRLPREYNAERIMKNLSKLHPNFYPHPSVQVRDEKTGRPVTTEPVSTPYLTKKKLATLYSECGSVLHKGSFEKLLQSGQPTPDFKRISDWKNLITTLLNRSPLISQNPLS